MSVSGDRRLMITTVDATDSQAGSQAWRFWATLGAITLVSFLFRWITTAHFIAGDEAQTANIAVLSWPDLFKAIRNDSNPPLFYILLKMWVMVAGASDFSLKFFVQAINLAIAPISYLLLRRSLGERLAVQLALLICISGPLLGFAEKLRSYGLLVVLTLLATFQLTRVLKNENSLRDRLLYAGLLAACIYTHMSATVVVAGHAGSILWQFASKEINRRQLRSWALAFALFVLFILPQIDATIYGLSTDCQPWKSGVNPLLTPVIIPLVMYPSLGNSIELIPLLALHFACWMSLIWSFMARDRIKQKYPNLDIGTWQTVLLCMVVAEIGLATSVYRSWYLISFVVPFLLLFVLHCEGLLQKCPLAARILLPLLFWLPFAYQDITHCYNQRDTYAIPKICAVINKHRNDNPPPLTIVSREWYAPAAAKYLDPSMPMLSLPDVERVSVVNFAHFKERLLDPTNFDKLTVPMSEQLNKGGVIFHIQFLPPNRTDIADNNEVAWEKLEASQCVATENWLRQHATLLEEQQLLDATGRVVVMTRFQPRNKDVKPTIVVPAVKP
jgi:hypothetical protein